MRISHFLCALAAVAVAGSAQALTVNLTLDQEIVGDQIIFTVGLDQEVAVSSFDVSVGWDPTELTLDSTTLLYTGGLPFGAPGDDRARLASLNIAGPLTTDLFSIAFDITNPIADGIDDDFFVYVLTGPLDGGPIECPAGRDCSGDVPNGTGIAAALGSTEPLEFGNRNGFAVGIPASTVPEPGSLALLLAALAPLALRRR